MHACLQVDIVPREEIKQEGEGMTVPGPGPGLAAAGAVRPASVPGMAVPGMGECPEQAHALLSPLPFHLVSHCAVDEYTHIHTHTFSLSSPLLPSAAPGQMYYPFPPQGMDPSGMGLRPPGMTMDPMLFQQQFMGQQWAGGNPMQQIQGAPGGVADPTGGPVKQQPQ